MPTNVCDHGELQTYADYDDILEDIGLWSIALGIVLIIGAVVAVVPQHISILKNQSTRGISPLWVFLSQINQYSAFLNAFLLNVPLVRSCSVVSFAACSRNLLAVYQIFATWLIGFPLFMWQFLYTERTSKDWRQVIYSFILFVFLAVVLLVVSLVLIEVKGDCGQSTLTFGKALGYASVVFTVIQWAPQLWKTWFSKTEGSFSIIMLLIQIPGSMLIVFFLAVVTKQDFTTWIGFVLSVIAQILLLGMIILFKIQKKRGVLTDEEKEHLVFSSKLDEE